MQARIETRSQDVGCTVGAVRDSTGHVYVFSNADNGCTTRMHLGQVDVDGAEGIQAIALRPVAEADCWWEGAYNRCLNSCGVGFTWACVKGENIAMDRLKKSLCQLTATVMSKRTAVEAVQAVWNGAWCTGGNFVIADAREVFLLELDDTGIASETEGALSCAKRLHRMEGNDMFIVGTKCHLSKTNVLDLDKYNEACKHLSDLRFTKHNEAHGMYTADPPFADWARRYKDAGGGVGAGSASDVAASTAAAVSSSTASAAGDTSEGAADGPSTGTVAHRTPAADASAGATMSTAAPTSASGTLSGAALVESLQSMLTHRHVVPRPSKVFSGMDHEVEPWQCGGHHSTSRDVFDPARLTYYNNLGGKKVTDGVEKAGPAEFQAYVVGDAELGSHIGDNVRSAVKAKHTGIGSPIVLART